jgi:hypothetical protein
MTSRDFELLSIAVIHEIVAPVVDSQLEPQGFVSLKPLQWVRSNDKPVRQVFEYRQLKGGALAPAWGYSFDFVPHFAGREMKWHRTEKSALFDAFVDGQHRRDLVLTYMYGVPGLVENLASRVFAAVQTAGVFWGRGARPGGVYSLVEELRNKPGAKLFAQLPIANAFCLARSGRETDGRAELERFIQDRSRYPSTELSDTTVAKVWGAFKDAAVAATKMGDQ